LLRGKRPRATADISQKDRRQPGVKLTLAEALPGPPVTTRKVKIKIEVDDALPDPANPQGSGARDLRLFETALWCEPGAGDVLNLQTACCSRSGGARSSQVRTVFVGVCLQSRQCEKQGRHARLVAGADRLRRSGTLYVLAIGNQSICQPAVTNLRYAVADAREFGAEMLRQQSHIARFGHIRDRRVTRWRRQPRPTSFKRFRALPGLLEFLPGS